MAYCRNCGQQMPDYAKFCPSCGTTAGDAGQSQQQNTDAGGTGYRATSSSSSDDMLMGILAYIGILVLVPIFAAKDSKFARYHANQGLILLIAEVAYGVVTGIITAAFGWPLFGFAIALRMIFNVLWLGFLALVILGIINVTQGKTTPLPVIGGFTILQ